jgi:hypothetical protein
LFVVRSFSRIRSLNSRGMLIKVGTKRVLTGKDSV